MATPNKPYTPSSRSSAAPKISSAPQTSDGDKRSFDARPKATNEHRREVSVRPTQHVDPLPADPVDEEA